MANEYFYFKPTAETWVAFLSAVLMVPIYYMGTHAPNELVFVLVFSLLGNLMLNVVFPVCYILWVKKSTLADLGIRRVYWKTSLLISCVLAALFLHPLLAINPSGTLMWHHLLFNALSLWEPFFVYGWLLLCFDRAFGAVFGVFNLI